MQKKTTLPQVRNGNACKMPSIKYNPLYAALAVAVFYLVNLTTAFAIVFADTSPANDCILPKEPNSYYIDSSLKDLPLQDKMGEEAVFHLFSHGKPGSLFLEGQWKSTSEIAKWLVSNDFLKEKSHLNIYGCNFAKDEKGRAAVEYLEAALGVSVAASDDVKGIDRDWHLEVGKGQHAIRLKNYCNNLSFISLWDYFSNRHLTFFSTKEKN